jgi:hypothetical protein
MSSSVVPGLWQEVWSPALRHRSSSEACCSARSCSTSPVVCFYRAPGRFMRTVTGLLAHDQDAALDARVQLAIDAIVHPSATVLVELAVVRRAPDELKPDITMQILVG